MDLVWEKLTIAFYLERYEKPKREALAVVRARKLVIVKEEGEFSGTIEHFFPLMGDIDYVSTTKGISDQYVLCWFDDKMDDFDKSWRRLTGVTFPDGISFLTDKKGKRSYNANFKAKQGKLN